MKCLLCRERTLPYANLVVTPFRRLGNRDLRRLSNSMPDIYHVAFLLSYAADLYQQRRQWENQQRRANHPNRQDLRILRIARILKLVKFVT